MAKDGKTNCDEPPFLVYVNKHFWTKIITSKEFLYLSFGLKRGTEKLKVRNRDAEGLTAINLHKTYFSPSNRASFFELHFGFGPEIWTLEELTAVLLDSSADTEILNVDSLKIVSNDEGKWIQV